MPLINLPLSPFQALQYAIVPALAALGARRYDSPQARVLMLAIALQESALATRRQKGGPARGLWQFELGGGVSGVLQHAETKDAAAILCRRQRVKADARSVYSALEADDLLAAGFARLLLFSDPAPLPAIGDEAAAWAYYKRNWRPGKPRPDHWPANYAQALAAVGP